VWTSASEELPFPLVRKMSALATLLPDCGRSSFMDSPLPILMLFWSFESICPERYSGSVKCVMELTYDVIIQNTCFISITFISIPILFVEKLSIY